jgi:hypothetical protein
MKTQCFPTSKKVQHTEVIKQDVSSSGKTDGILLVNYLEKGATIMVKYYVALLDKLKQPLVSKHQGKHPKLSCFFKTMLLLPRQPLHTINWQIFAMRFLNTGPTHMIWPLHTTTSFLTSRNTSGKESFQALRRPH